MSTIFYQNEEQFLKVREFLNLVNQSSGYKMDTAKTIPLPSELYVASKINAGGTSSLLLGSTVQEQGITNFDGNRLANDRHFVANAVTILYGEGNASDNIVEIDFLKKELPAVLLSSTLVIRQNQQVIAKLPLISIELAKKNQTDFYRNLGAFLLLKPNDQIDIEIITPSGSRLSQESGDTSFVKVLLRGFETFVKR